jgi:hypothetical protein
MDMSRKILYGIILFFFAYAFIACKKSRDVTEAPPVDESTITPVGAPLGTAVRKTIGAQGGELSSADGTIKVIVPAGALDAAKEISIQAITNELPGGIGNAFRILPHGEQFKKPVSIKFTYKPGDLEATLPDLLDIAWQDTTGSWITPANPVLDKANRTLTINTTHFSDWGYFKSLTLTPEEATVALGGSVDLVVTTRFPYLDPDDAPSGQEVIKVLRTPRELRSDEIKKWTYEGDGILISRGAQAFYTAPGKEPETNPEAVVANINMHRKGQFMLISNITVMAGHNVAFLHVDEDYKSQLNNGNCRLYMYGNFGADPGVGKRTVKINGNTVEVDLWSPNIVRCNIDREISGAIEIIANNKTVARSVLRKYTGKFVYRRFHGGKINAGGSNPLKEETEFTIVYRGFGAACPANIDPVFLLEDRLVALGTRADYTLRGAASITTPEICPLTSSITLPDKSGTLLLNTISESPDNRLDVRVNDIEDGIEMTMDFRVVDVVTGVRVKRSNCNLSWEDPPRPLGVGLEGFGHKAIPLVFTETGALKLKGTDELKSGNMSSGILIEAWDGTGSPSHYESDGLMQATFRNK